MDAKRCSRPTSRGTSKPLTGECLFYWHLPQWDSHLWRWPVMKRSQLTKDSWLPFSMRPGLGSLCVAPLLGKWALEPTPKLKSTFQSICSSQIRWLVGYHCLNPDFTDVGAKARSSNITQPWEITMFRENIPRQRRRRDRALVWSAGSTTAWLQKPGWTHCGDSVFTSVK